MKIFLGPSAMLLVLSTAAWGQQPAVYPLRSQSAAAQGVDSAYCYWHAKQETGVDMTRLSQRPPRTKSVRFAPDAGKGASEPPLPQGAGAGRPGASAANGGASATQAASSAPNASAARAASVSAAQAAPAGSAASAAQPGAPVPAATATGSAAASSPGPSSRAASANSPPLPALPPPEPPMATYWHAYGDCMQARGYGVQ